MADHKHGQMDTSAQERTFEGFVRWVTRVVIAVVAVLILLALVNA